jgi:regulator of sigma E protease
LKAGDALVGLIAPDGGTLEGAALNVESVQNFVRASVGAPLSVHYQRGAIFKDADLPVASVTVTPTITADAPPAIGVGLDQVVIARAGPLGALWRSLRLTVDLTVATAEAIFNFIFDAFRGQGSLSDVTGPVGLVGLVGDARTLGFVYLLSFTALISINLAIVNLIPFPALDGGRLLFLLIEKIKGSPLKPAVANWANILGFILLLGLMAIITASDLTKLF